MKVCNFVVEFATPGIGHILEEAGLDFAFFDMEHSGFGFETLKSAIRYFEAAGMPVIVRVPALEADVRAVLDVMKGQMPRGIVNHDVMNNPGFKAKLEAFGKRFG